MCRQFDLLTQDLDHQHMPNHFHATAGAARATTDKHQHEEHRPPKAVPAVKIVGAKPGRGHDRNDLK